MNHHRPSLQGIGLTRSFGSGSTLAVALKDASLEVFPGEFALVMGPSGGGKSTLLAVLSGLLRPDSGQTLVHGEGASYAEAHERVGDMLALLGLAKKADLLPAELSGGEKQRVAIGRALIKQPAFCFADEPTSALDWAHGQQVIELLRTAAIEYRSTVVVVAHDARIAPYAHRVFHMEDGCLSEPARSGRTDGHSVPQLPTVPGPEMVTSS